MGFSNIFISVFWWEKPGVLSWRQSYKNICSKYFWPKTKVARILKRCCDILVFQHLKIAIWCRGITPRLKKKSCLQISRISNILHIIFFQRCFGDFSLHQKALEDFWKYEEATPHAFKTMIIVQKHKNKYYYDIELELDILYEVCQRDFFCSLNFFRWGKNAKCSAM